MLDLKYWEASLTEETRYSLEMARKQFEITIYFNSLNKYITLLDKIGEDGRQCIYIEFMECFQKCLEINTEICIEMGIADLLFSYYPESIEICKFHARTLFSKEEVFKSVQAYKNAINLTESPHERIKLLIEMGNAQSHLFDQWHFPMLNDKQRNCQFGLAIKRCIQEFNFNQFIHVVDLGCGTGILSTMISRELKKKLDQSLFCVSAIDSNPVMINVAEQVFEKNNVIVDPYCIHSSKFNSNKPINLVVSETLDCALFGEHFISSLIDLYDRLGDKSCFNVLPCKATFYLSLCECRTIESQHFSEKSNAIENYVLLSNECYLNWPIDTKDGLNDPYDSIQLDEIKDGYSLLSEPVEAFTVNFNDIEFSKRIILKNKFQKRVLLKADKNGRASCVVGWFKLDLGNGINIETAPGQKTCWPQAVFPFYPPTQLEFGDSLNLYICINDEKLHICPTNLASFDRKKMRLQPSTDFVALNNQIIQTYFYNSIDYLKSKDVVDMTDLLIQQKDDCNFQYITTEPHILQIINQNAPFDDLKPKTTILHWPFNSFGSLDEIKIETLKTFVKKHRKFMNLIPFGFKLCGMLIQSDQFQIRSSLVSLDIQNEIYNGVDISPMQNYYIQHFHELDLQTLEYESISEISTLLTCSFNDIIDGTIKDDSILQNIVKLKMTKPNSYSNAFVYWIELNNCDNGPNLSFRQLPTYTSAFTFGKNLETKERTEIELRVSMYNYQFNFEFN